MTTNWLDLAKEICITPYELAREANAKAEAALRDGPSIRQVADAILAHYGTRQVGAMHFDDPRDASLCRTLTAERLLRAVKHDVRAAIAAIEALSMETAHDVEAVGVVQPKASPAPTNRVAAWEANPHCVACGEVIADPRECGALYGASPLRVAHAMHPTQQTSCFIRALAKMRAFESIKTIVPRALERSGLEIVR